MNIERVIDMALYMIGTIRRDFKQIIGYRIFDTESNRYKDVPFAEIVKFIIGNNKIQNLEISPFGEVVSTNGAFDRYAKIIYGVGIAGPSPLVILMKFANGEFDVVNGSGNRARMKEANIIDYSETDGIANGKVVEKEGTKFISSINGEFEQEKVKSQQDMINKATLAYMLASVDPGYTISDDGTYEITAAASSKVEMPEGVSQIKAGTFNKKELTSLTTPSSLKEIKKDSFKGLNVKRLVLKNGTVKLDAEAFSGARIETLCIAPTVNSIDRNAFRASMVNKIEFYNRAQKNMLDDSKPAMTRLVFGAWKG